jgi:hypothetical protein
MAEILRQKSHAMDNVNNSSMILRFLDDYVYFGSFGHLLTAQTLLSAIQSTTDVRNQKLLAVKVYSEFGGAIEDLVAMCIAIRHRDDPNGLIYAYLTYGQSQRRNPLAPSTQVREMLRHFEAKDGLVTGLQLPSLEQILASDPSLGNSTLPPCYQEVNNLLAKVAEMYFTDDEALVRVYNKTKHGFVVVEDVNLLFGKLPDIRKDQTWIIGDNPNFRGEQTPNDCPIERTEIRLYDVAPLIDRIATIRSAVFATCQIVIYLLRRGLITATFHDP